MYVDYIMYISIMKLTLFMMPLHSIYLAVAKLGYSLIHCKYLHFNLCNEFLFFQIEKKNHQSINDVMDFMNVTIY